jgi:hypothetical protein
MKLKTYLKRDLNGDVEHYKKRAEETREMLKVLERTDLDHATYSVDIISRWTDAVSAPCEGEKDVRNMKHKGTLKDAVKKAEKKFMEINDRSDIQADYDVELMLNRERIEIPEKYYKAYKHVYKDKPERKPKKR